MLARSVTRQVPVVFRAKHLLRDNMTEGDERSGSERYNVTQCPTLSEPMDETGCVRMLKVLQKRLFFNTHLLAACFMLRHTKDNRTGCGIISWSASVATSAGSNYCMTFPRGWWLLLWRMRQQSKLNLIKVIETVSRVGNKTRKCRRDIVLDNTTNVLADS